MHTDISLPPPTTHRIAAGQAQGFHLSQGSEVFCGQGPLQLTTVPMARWEGCCDQTLPLAPGQSWRAPQDLWVHLAAVRSSAPGSVGWVRITPGPARHQRPALQGLERWWQPLLRLTGRLWRGRGIRRARRAA